MKRIHFITCVLLTAAVDMYGQLTTEYFFDTDPGHGKATQETTKAGDNALTLRTSQLDAGMHLLGIRSADGEGRWSPTLTSPIYVFAPKTDVAAAEWCVDTDPGYGKGTSMPASAGSNVLVISTKGMSSGMHLICVRSRSLSGQWSPTLTSPLYVAEPLDAAGAEWFVDADPGEGKANAIDISGKTETAFIVPTAGMAVGNHSLTVRIRTAAGNWLPFTVTPFSVTVNAGVAEVKSIMDVGIRRMAGRIVLTRTDNIGEACVDIVTVDGVKRAAAVWPAGSQEISVDVQHGLSPVIVAVTRKDGTRFVKLIK